MYCIIIVLYYVQSGVSVAEKGKGGGRRGGGGRGGKGRGGGRPDRPIGLYSMNETN